MAVRARIEHDLAYDGVALHLVRKAGPRIIEQASLGDGELRWATHDPMAETTPVLRLDEDTARVLCDALVIHFHGTLAEQQLRADYDHERRRVDKMLDALLVMAAGPSLDWGGKALLTHGKTGG